MTHANSGPDPDDLEELADLIEDQLDLKEAMAILAEIESGKSRTVPFAEICAELGI